VVGSVGRGQGEILWTNVMNRWELLPEEGDWFTYFVLFCSLFNFPQPFPTFFSAIRGKCIYKILIAISFALLYRLLYFRHCAFYKLGAPVPCATQMRLIFYHKTGGRGMLPAPVGNGG